LAVAETDISAGSARLNRRKLLRRLSGGALHNVSFGDMTSLAEGFGFRRLRVSGSHHIYAHQRVAELINLQDVGGEAKPYQIRQFLRLVERYDLILEEER
jgi:predicted RNA binding protein YcfA (HicA-like mRNA interferase family)